MVSAKEIQTNLKNAQVAMFERADLVVKNSTKEIERSRKLKSIGFDQAVGADFENRIARDIQVVTSNSLYQKMYPGFRFIPNHVMTDVCNEYGLVVGPVDRYRGQVPDWALDHLDRNKHLFKQKREVTVSYEELSVGDNYETDDEWNNIYVSSRNDKFTNVVLSNFYSGDKRSVGMNNKAKVTVYMKPPKLVIAAPIDMMDTSGMRLDGVNLVENLDPIVCLQFKEGYVVLAAWDEEGKDPRILNSELN